MSRRKKQLREIVPSLSSVYRYFWPFARRYRWIAIGSFSTAMISVVMRLLEPWPLKFVLDLVLSQPVDASSVRIRWLETLAPLEALALAAVALVSIAAVRAAAEYLSRVGFFIVGNKAVILIRDRVYRHLQSLSLAYHQKMRTGDMVIRVTRDVSLLRDITATAVLPMLTNTVVLLGMLLVMFALRWQLALTALVAVPLFCLTTVRIGRRIRVSARKQRQREGAMASNAAECLHAIADVKTLNLENWFADSFSSRNRAGEKEDLKANRLSIRLARVIDFWLAISSAVVLWFGARFVIDGGMTAGDLVIFLTYLNRAFQPSQDFAKYTARLAKATAAGERVIEVLEETAEVTEVLGARELAPSSGEVSLSDLSFSYTDGVPVQLSRPVGIQLGFR